MNSENQSKEEPEKKTGKKKNRPWLSLSYIFGGKVLTEDFIVKQSGLLLTIFILILLFITNRYYCAKQLTEMDKLKKELIDLKNEQINLIYDLTSISGQSQIEELLRKKGVEVTKANTTTVYQIKN